LNCPDVFLFSKLPEADQQAILCQANKDEFDRYINHAHMKLRKPMRRERAGAWAGIESAGTIQLLPRRIVVVKRRGELGG
jgi:hypothetical protein